MPGPSPIATTSFTLTATGVGFRNGAVLRFNGSNRPTTWLSATQVRATATASVSANSLPVVVTNPDGVASNTAYGNVTLPSLSPITVKISPVISILRRFRTKQFTATVTGSTNTAVTWKVNGVTGGNATYGTVSTTGLYRVSAALPASGRTVTLTAVSKANTTKSASALITLDFRGPAYRAATPWPMEKRVPSGIRPRLLVCVPPLILLVPATP